MGPLYVSLLGAPARQGANVLHIGRMSFARRTRALSQRGFTVCINDQRHGRKDEGCRKPAQERAGALEGRAPNVARYIEDALQ